MIRVGTCFFVIVVLCLISSGALFGQDSNEDQIRRLEERIRQLEQQLENMKQTSGSDAALEEIRRQVAILAAEVEKLRSGEADLELEDTEARTLGLGPSASTIYRKREGVSLAGYGEMLYQNIAEENDSGQPTGAVDNIDFLRAIVYFGYRFNDRFLFNSEIEFEHASTDNGGTVSVEFAYLDFRATEDLSLRGGMVLLPMGFLNEFHEPTSFLGARRPLVETFIIPTTWRENGFGFVGRTGIFDYRAYLVNGLEANRFSPNEGLRGGRQKGARAKIDKPVFTGRLDISPTPGLLFGGSLYYGDSSDFATDLDLQTTIVEGHLEYKIRGLELRGLYARATLDDVQLLNESLGLIGNQSIGERMTGGYLQAGYNLLAGRTDTTMSLTPYVRYETVNTQAEVPAGFLSNPANDRTLTTLGVEFRPIWNITIKTDYQIVDNDADTGVDQFNIVLGYSF